MIRATTPTHIFTFPETVAPADCAEIQITYAQGEKSCHRYERIILEKNKSDLTITGQKAELKLTQQEMNLFSEGTAQIQIRAKDTDGNVMASQIFYVKVKRVLNQEVL